MKVYENLKEKVYYIVKQKILSGEYRPNSHLDEKKLIAELEVSRTPFREAMNRLELENFITIIPRRGFFVTEISIKNINDIFQARHLIEPQLVDCCSDYISKEKLLEIKEKFKNWDRLSREEFIAVDWEFHYLILKSTNNETLIKIMTNIYEQSQRFRTLITKKVSREENSAQEHIDIIDAILTGDTNKAREACVLHTRNSHLDTLNMIGLLNL